MKKTIIYSFLIAFAVLATSATIQNIACDAASLKAPLKDELKPDYKYDSSKIIQFPASAEFQGKKIEVPLFDGEKYRFVFNTKGVDKNFQIYISDRKDSKKFLFALKEVREEGKDIYIFEPEKSQKLYITYIMPPALKEAQNSCVAFMLGYKL